MTNEKTIFSKIIDGEIPANIVYQNNDCICIKDIQPQAPTHLLIIPRKPIPKLVDATLGDKALLGSLMLTVGELAQRIGVADAFRVVINNGADAGQTVFHLHLHLLADKIMSEDSLND